MLVRSDSAAGVGADEGKGTSFVSTVYAYGAFSADRKGSGRSIQGGGGRPHRTARRGRRISKEIAELHLVPVGTCCGC